MTDSVNFSTTVGGDGTVITNDRAAGTGIKGGGHVSRFVKALEQTVAVANFVVSKAIEVSNNAAEALIAKNAAALSAAEALTIANNLGIQPAWSRQITGTIPVLLGTLQLAPGAYIPSANVGCTDASYTATIVIKLSDNSILSTVGDSAGGIDFKTGASFIVAANATIYVFLQANHSLATAVITGFKLS